MKRCDLDLDSIEGQILYSMDRVQRQNAEVTALMMTLDRDRVTLRNYIAIYRQQISEAQMDDLIAAVIKDDILQEADLRFVFDLSTQELIECTHRINARNISKW
jgi:hypothetical protein